MSGVKMIKRILPAVLTGLLLTASITGCGLFLEEEDALVPPLAVPEEVTYRTEAAATGHIENSIDCVGCFVLIKNENHMFKYPNGRIKKIYVNSGDAVKKGDLLAELITDSLENDIKLQRLNFEAIRTDSESSKQLHEIDLKQAKKVLKQFEEKYRLMTETKEAYSKRDIETAINDVNNQKDLIDKLILSNKSRTEAKKYEIEAAQIKLDNLNKQREASRLTALIDGQVTYASPHKEGDYIDAYSTLVTIADPLEMQIEYKGNASSKFNLGMKVELKKDDKKFSGEVVFIPSSAPVGEMEHFRDVVRIKLSDKADGFKAGDNVDIKLVLEEKDNVLMVYKSAVHMYSGNHIVNVLEDGLRVEKYVKIGITSANMVEIVEGLKPGEMVIIG